jgi:ProP effector
MTAPASNKPSRNALLDTLVSTYAVFRECRPLALGIHKTLRERSPELTQDAIRVALKIHTGSTRYLKSLTQTEQRFDLDDQPAGTVTPEQKEIAANTLRERYKKSAERRQAELQAKKFQENLNMLAEKFKTH